MNRIYICMLIFSVSFLSAYGQEYREYSKAEEQSNGYITRLEADPIHETNITTSDGITINTRIHNKACPRIVFIPGYGATQNYWNALIRQLGDNDFPGILTYDRNGYGKSSYTDSACDARQAAVHLAEILEISDIKEPVIIAAHSYGGHIARLFAAMYPARICGLLLIEEPHENFRKSMEEILLPDELDFYSRMNKEMASFPVSHPGMKGETLSMDKTFDQLRSCPRLPDIPCIVLTAGSKKSFNEFSEQTIARLRKLEFKLQNDLASLIPGSKHYIIRHSGHNLPVDQPQAVIDALSELTSNL